MPSHDNAMQQVTCDSGGDGRLSNHDTDKVDVRAFRGRHSRQGKQYRVHERICWRQLEGRHCFDAASRALASSTDVVIVMLYPSRKNREGEEAGSFERDVTRIQTAVANLKAELLSAGIRAILDADGRQTPRARFVHWEECGVAMRLEYGLKEVSEETACLWVHKAHAGLLHEVMASPQTEKIIGHGQSLRIVNQRVLNIPARAVVPFCKCLLEHIAAAEMLQNGGTGNWAEWPPQSQTHAKSMRVAEAQVRPPSPLCTKLHLANELAEAAGKTSEVCVPHLYFLAGRGRPCYCTSQYHPSLDKLRECVLREVERIGGSPPEKQVELIWDTDDAVDAATDGQKLVVVGNIPHACQGKKLATQIQTAFAPYELIRVYGSKARREFSHGWARVLLPSLAHAQAAVENLNAQLEHAGHVLSVAMSAGRLDTLFPMFPYEVRSKLRVGSVAAYSVTDQTTADTITMLTSTVAENLFLHDSTAIESASGGALLPLIVTDGTACSGGNTLSLMRRFAAVHAVEIDEDRVADLRHNVELVLSNQIEGSGPQVTTHHGEFLNLMAKLKQDILLLDPPWGGPSYNADGELFDLFLSNTSVASLAVEILRKKASMLVVRLPHILKTHLFLESMAAASRATRSSEGEHGKLGASCTVFDVSFQIGRSIVLILARVNESDRRDSFERRLKETLRDRCRDRGIWSPYKLGNWHEI